jgi:hypothetical protein
MYKTKDITKKELQAINVVNQDEIKDLNFILDSRNNEIVNPKIKKSKKKNDTNEIIRLQEKERARALELLELELLIAA